MFWKIKKMLVSSTNIKKYRAKNLTWVSAVLLLGHFTCTFLLDHVKDYAFFWIISFKAFAAP
ncbi:hypothetical protein FXN81_06670 [Enterococcus faecium]|nr:hypothetical protein [Enterococcus faecium]NDK46152.1 hypothetical protein [Enterococcus faecium]